MWRYARISRLREKFICSLSSAVSKQGRTTSRPARLFSLRAPARLEFLFKILTIAASMDALRGIYTYAHVYTFVNLDRQPSVGEWGKQIPRRLLRKICFYVPIHPLSLSFFCYTCNNRKMRREMTRSLARSRVNAILYAGIFSAPRVWAWLLLLCT